MFKLFPAILLTGPRQVGKTSLLRHLYPKASYLSFDHPSIAKQAEETPQELLSSLKEPVILDEIQYVPSFFRHLKIFIDQKKVSGRFLLTGSQTFPLMQGVSESLAGRCGILEMNSLSFSEVQASLPKKLNKDYLITGGFPEIYRKQLRHPYEWYASYVTTYLERDVRNIKNIGSLRDFERLMRVLALRTGQQLVYSDIAKDVGISTNTARDWVSILHSSAQVYLLEPYHRSLGKRLVKSPKIYFLDTGLACFLVGIESWPDLLRSPLLGAFWETYVVGQLIRYFHERGKKPPLWYWRTSYGEEVDLVLEKGGRLIAIECKFSEQPDKNSLKGFFALQKFYGKAALEKGYVVCRTSHPFKFPKLPIYTVSGSEISNLKL